jgi:ketosteroid isomerase-like protein
MSSVEENNKALVRRFVEAFANGDLETLDELLAPDYVDHSLFPGQEPGNAGRWWATQRRSGGRSQ